MESKEISLICLTFITVLSVVAFLISFETNMCQCTQINELKGKEKVYRMQIHHYNPNDYTLQIKETP